MHIIPYHTKQTENHRRIHGIRPAGHLAPPLVPHDHAHRDQIPPRRGMRQGHLHLLVRSAQPPIRPMRRGIARRRVSKHRTPHYGVRSGGRTRFFVGTVVARSDRGCRLVRGIHRTRGKAVSTELPHGVPEGRVDFRDA